MYDQNHDADYYLVDHQREADEGNSDHMVEHPLIVFPLLFPSHHYELKQRKQVDSKLKTEVALHLGSFFGGPIWVVLVDLYTFSLTPQNFGKPILISKLKKAINRYGGVKQEVEG